MTDATAVVSAPRISLYELGEEFQRLELALWESGGEVTPEVEEAFAVLGVLEGTKCDNYVELARSLERYRDATEVERDQLTANLRAAKNAIQQLKDWTQAYLERRGIQEIRGRYRRAWLQKDGGIRRLSVLVEPTALPPDFQVIKVSADTDKLRALAQENLSSEEEIELTVDGAVVARLEHRGQGVRFR